MHEERFWNLLAKKLAGEATEEEVRELASIIKANPSLSFEAQNVADLWKLEPRFNNLSAKLAYQDLLLRLEKVELPVEIDTESNFPSDQAPKRKWKAAVFFAGAICLFVLGYFLWQQPVDKTPVAGKQQTEEIFARPGTRTKITLPDGTTVFLNAGSKLTYSRPFGTDNRAVKLSGEAYFDVVKSTKPFIISTNGARIKVLGTAFNVRSYPGEKKIETSLIHGLVEIMLDRYPKNKYFLTPNQKLTLNIAAAARRETKKAEPLAVAVYDTLYPSKDKTIAEISWVENKLVFDDEPFDEVVRKMERWYNVSIDIKDEKLKKERLKGTFEKESLRQASLS